MIELKHLAFEAMCVDERDMPKLKGGRETYRVFHDTLGDIGKATVCLVSVEDHDWREFFADVKTGSLYDPETMRCMTGSLELRQ